MSTKRLTIVASVIAVMLVLTLPRPAAAQGQIGESLVYPGSNCIKVTGGTPTFFASVDPLNNSQLHGRLRNDTTTTMVVQCPMYDNGTNFTGRVWVIDNSVTQNITCCSKIRNPVSGAANQCKSTSGNSSSTKTLDFDGPDQTGTFGYRFYDCSLPPTTQIISYRGIAQ
jgi:hypothetical protein